MPIFPTKNNPNPYGDGNIGISISEEERLRSRAREGYGGGSGKKDIGYNPKTGTTNFGNKEEGYTQKIVAPRNGVMGVMVPGQPSTWREIDSSNIGSQAAARRYEQLKGAAVKEESGKGPVQSFPEKKTNTVATGKKRDTKQSETKTEPEKNVTSRNVPRNRGIGTQTGPSPVRFDGTEGMDAFIKKLQGEYGITFGGQGGRTPMESTNLPDTSTGKMVSITNGKNAGKYVDVNNPDFDEIVRGTKEGGVAGEQTTGGGTKGGLTAALADTDGMRSYMKRVTEAEAPEGDDGTGPMAYATDGLDARSRAFLDYDGKGGSMMALRAADAAQNTVYAGGKLYDVSGKNDDGKYNVVNDEGREFLRQNRNATTDAQEYMDAYKKGVVVPEDAKSPDSVNPEMSSRPSYIQQSQREMGGTLVMGPDDKLEPFENNTNRSYITGAPTQDIYNTTNNPFVDTQEPPTTGFLVNDEAEEEIKRLYLK